MIVDIKEICEYSEIIEMLKSLSNPKAVEGMARFRINPKGILGVSIPNLRKIAKAVGKDHEIASRLWKSGFHEARLLAGFIDDPALVTLEQMEKWVRDFDSWDICDQVCSNLFDKTPFAFEKAVEWAGRREEFVKRAGFVLMAALAVHDKDASEGEFGKVLSMINREAFDERNFVKKKTLQLYRAMTSGGLALRERAGKETVGAVALDRAGTVAAGASTGGVDLMLPGRVGDTPIIGCGVYADNESGAVSMTGLGEGIVRIAVAKEICDRLEQGTSPAMAARAVLRKLVTRIDGAAGALVLSPDGRFTISHVTPRMAAGWWDGKGKPVVKYRI